MHSSVDRKPTISMRLPRALLEEIDDLVRRTRMRSRTEFVERAVETYMDELREARIVVVREWTEAKASAAVLRFLKGRPDTYVTDIEEAFGMELVLVFRVGGASGRDELNVDRTRECWW